MPPNSPPPGPVTGVVPPSLEGGIGIIVKKVVGPAPPPPVSSPSFRGAVNAIGIVD